MTTYSLEAKAGPREQQHHGREPPVLHHAKPERQWPGVLLASVLLALLTQAAMHRDVALAAGQRLFMQMTTMQAQPPPSLLEQQLMGCRTFKSQPLPFVNTSASLAVVETWSEEERTTAEAFTAAVSACTDFACLQRANELPRAPGQFRYPHFMVLGFPKCATTSVYCHMIQHPQVQYPKEKESHWLMDKCGRDVPSCAPEAQQQYVVEILNMAETSQSLFTKATFDGSTHYAAEGQWLAPQLRATFPWAKLAISMRDPISQSLSMYLHNFSHNRTAPCWENTGHRIYTCVLQDLVASDRARYAPSVEHWMRHFPKDQILLMQYESLINRGSMAADLQALKGFLGMHLHDPSDALPLTNWKHKRGDEHALGRYWNMTRTEYEHLVDLARRDTMEVLRIMDRYGVNDRQARIDWLRNWEMVWRLNLRDNCEEGPQGNCRIVVS